MPIDQDENEDPSRVPPKMQGSEVSDSKELKNSTIESINSNGSNFGSCDAVIAIAIEEMSDTAVSRASIAANDSGIENAAVSCVPGRRKRPQPPKIEIPSFVKELCFCERKKRRSPKKNEIIQSFESGVAVLSVRGRRKKKKKQLEDRFKVVRAFNGDLKKSFFGVYDGHRGQEAVNFVTQNLHEIVLDAMNKNESNLGKVEVMKAAYLKTDSEFLKLGKVSGTCCVTCLVEEKEITVSNSGDCRAVLCRVDGTAEALTKDHKAGDEDERRRVEQMGGCVVKRGCWRVQGDLAISRSIGDAHLKRWVLAEPDTKVLNITPDMEFLILASDGLWDKVSNMEAADIAKNAVAPLSKLDISNSDKSKFDYKFGWEKTSPPTKGSTTSTGEQQKTPAHESNGVTKRPFRLLTACEKLVKASIRRGSSDDITVMVIDLMQLRVIGR
ncbi:hypothetical protein Syun_024245 [Stephania yunnanensis]|uniref:PPM-type phosphatase domain-containing protein n=1 Tax=Stephania yunnanensis TaxID=152371 RepID=A0AAP0NIG4_9MAGN